MFVLNCVISEKVTSLHVHVWKYVKRSKYFFHVFSAKHMPRATLKYKCNYTVTTCLYYTQKYTSNDINFKSCISLYQILVRNNLPFHSILLLGVLLSNLGVQAYKICQIDIIHRVSDTVFFMNFLLTILFQRLIIKLLLQSKRR